MPHISECQEPRFDLVNYPPLPCEFAVYAALATSNRSKESDKADSSRTTTQALKVLARSIAEAAAERELEDAERHQMVYLIGVRSRMLCEGRTFSGYPTEPGFAFSLIVRDYADSIGEDDLSFAHGTLNAFLEFAVDEAIEAVEIERSHD